MVPDSRSVNRPRRFAASRIPLWIRLGVLAFFGFYLGYVPLHLATEHHVDFHAESHAATVQQGHYHDVDHHHGEDGKHTPHSVLDHQFQFFVKNSGKLITFDCVPCDLSLSIFKPAFQLAGILSPSEIEPHESPPEPNSPRAPPLAS
jgi:hypothetical protein